MLSPPAVGLVPPGALAVSLPQVLLFLVLATLGFLVVVIVCAALLALIQLVLPSGPDQGGTGAAEGERGAGEDRGGVSPEEERPGGLDRRRNA